MCCCSGPPKSSLAESRTADFHLVSLESLTELRGARSFDAKPQLAEMLGMALMKTE